MKVMIINSLYYPNIIGGAEKSTQVIAENLKRFEIEPVVVTVSDREKTDFVNGVKVYYVFHSNVYWSYHSKLKNPFLKILWHLFSFYNPGILKKIDKILNAEKPDVVNTNNLSEFSVGIWQVIKRNKIPLVHTLRDYSLICPRATLFKRNKVCVRKNLICAIIAKYRKVFSKYPDAVIGNSDFVLHEHLKNGYFKNSEKFVVYNSLATPRISRTSNNRNGLKFGYIGHLSYHKGIEFLLNVFKENNIADLHVFGGGITSDYEKYIKEKYSSEKIIFHGFVNTDEAFSLLDVLIVPSLCHDTLPRVIYEAYSFGIPVIGSDRGGTPEIIDISKTGFVYRAESAEELIDKVNIFIKNPGLIDEMAPNCLKKARDFLPDNVMKKYIEIYKHFSKKENAAMA